MIETVDSVARNNICCNHEPDKLWVHVFPLLGPLLDGYIAFIVADAYSLLFFCVVLFYLCLIPFQEAGLTVLSSTLHRPFDTCSSSAPLALPWLHLR